MSYWWCNCKATYRTSSTWWTLCHLAAAVYLTWPLFSRCINTAQLRQVTDRCSHVIDSPALCWASAIDTPRFNYLWLSDWWRQRRILTSRALSVSQMHRTAPSFPHGKHSTVGLIASICLTVISHHCAQTSGLGIVTMLNAASSTWLLTTIQWQQTHKSRIQANW